MFLTKVTASVPAAAYTVLFTCTQTRPRNAGEPAVRRFIRRTTVQSATYNGMRTRPAQVSTHRPKRTDNVPTLLRRSHRYAALLRRYSTRFQAFRAARRYAQSSLRGNATAARHQNLFRSQRVPLHAAQDVARKPAHENGG